MGILYRYFLIISLLIFTFGQCFAKEKPKIIAMWFEAGFSESTIGKLPQRDLILPAGQKWKVGGICLDYMMGGRLSGLDLSSRVLLDWNSSDKEYSSNYFQKQLFLLSVNLNQPLIQNNRIKMTGSIGLQYFAAQFDTLSGKLTSFYFGRIEPVIGGEAFLFLRNKLRSDKTVKFLDHVIFESKYDRSIGNNAFEEFRSSLLLLCFSESGPDKVNGYLMLGYRSINRHNICRVGYNLIGIRGYVW
jgi:hypothetical protein